MPDPNADPMLNHILNLLIADPNWARKVAGEEIRKVLDQDPKVQFGRGLFDPPLNISTKASGDPRFPNLVDDPQMELALQNTQMEHPRLFKGLQNIRIGEPQEPGTLGQLFGANMSLGPTKSYAEALGLLRHELAHVAGWPDEGNPDAYLMDSLTRILNRDIELPAMKKSP